MKTIYSVAYYTPEGEEISRLLVPDHVAKPLIDQNRVSGYVKDDTWKLESTVISEWSSVAGN